MAFLEYCPTSLSLPNLSREGRIRATVSTLSIATQGLAPLYARIGRERRRSRDREGSIKSEEEHGYYTNDAGDLVLSSLLPLFGKRYRLVAPVGKGTFSQILQARDTFGVDRHGKNINVAIKVMNLRYAAVGRKESRCLKQLASAHQSEHVPFVKLITTFTYYGHVCLVRVMLREHRLLGDVSVQKPLATLLLGDGNSPSLLPVKAIRQGFAQPILLPHLTLPMDQVALQLMGVLLFLENHSVVHADIKPDNILLVESAEEGRVRVKLCDFGNAVHISEVSLYYEDFEIQTVAYRAPEVLLGCPFDHAIDMWSAGVVILELVLGRRLFGTADTRDGLVRQMMCAFGPLPLRRFRSGRFFSYFFEDNHSLKDRELEGGGVKPEPCAGECSRTCRCEPTKNVSGPPGVRRLVPQSARSRGLAPEGLQTLDKVAGLGRLHRLMRAAQIDGPLHERSQLVDLMGKLLHMNPDDRFSPRQAIMHPCFGVIFPFAATLGAASPLHRAAAPCNTESFEGKQGQGQGRGAVAVPIPREPQQHCTSQSSPNSKRFRVW